jgi:hypothetical protein
MTGEPINLDNRETKRLLRLAIDSMTGWWCITFKRHRSTDTTPQRGYLFGVVYVHMAAHISKLWGEPVNTWQVHVLCHRRFLDKPVCNHDTGEVIDVLWNSTSKFDVAEMAEYIDQVIAFAAELGCQVPPPSKGLKPTKMEE